MISSVRRAAEHAMTAPRCLLATFFAAALTLLASAAPAHAQAGQLDPTFNPGPITRGGALENYMFLYAVAVQPDGKIIIGGNFTEVNFAPRQFIARFNADGSLDSTFNTPIEAIPPLNGEIYDIVIQPDGRILVGGFFHVNGQRKNIVRLNPDGSLDSTFDANVDAWVYRIVLQPDGKIIIGSNALSSVDGVPVHYLARLNPDGSLDTPLGAVSYANSSVFAIVLQTDGKIVVAGSFYIVRLNADGTYDATFVPPDVGFRTIYAMALQGDGRIVYGGVGDPVTGQFIARLNPDGSPDAAFSPPLIQFGGPIWTVVVQADGKILFGGSFIRVNGVTRGSIARLNPDGSLDAFHPDPYGVDSNVEDIAVEADGNVLIVGDFKRLYNDVGFVERTGFARLLNGSSSKQPTTTTISSSLNPSTFGTQVTFTVTVGGANPTGTVTVLDGGVALAPPVALAGGEATIAVSSLTAGTHTLTAQYSGDAAYAGSTSGPLSQVVNKAVPAVTLISSRNPSAPGDAVTFSGTLPIDAIGTVTILNGTVSLGEVPVASGTFTLTTTTLSTGSHAIRARYNGDGNYMPGESAPLTQVVQVDNRAPQVSTPADQTVIWGSAVSLLVAAFDPDNDPLSFALVAAPSGASITSAGQFTWTPTSSQVGPTAITVEVSDGQAAATASFTVTVTKRATSVSYLGPGAASSGLVELSARLTDYQNAAIAGRTIAFGLATHNASGVTDSTGLAVASIMLDQPPGAVSVTASFAGDSAYEASLATLTFRVDAPPMVAAVPPQAVPWGQTLSFSISATDPEGSPLTFSLLSAPAGVGLNFESLTRRRVVWTPTHTQVGSNSITIGVSDSVTTVAVTVPVDVLRQAAAISQLGPGAAGAGPLQLTATLRAEASGTPLPSRVMTFALGTQTTSAATSSSGVASAVIDVLQAPATVQLVVSFEGDALYAPAQASQNFVIYSDVDGDGLRDEWEIAGVDIDGNGSVDLDLPAMGASPYRKDIFVEVDWMVKPMPCVWLVCWSNGGVLQPQPAALQMLIQSFATAPVSNPDGSIGITLHVDAGPETVMTAGQLWGARSRAGVVPYVESLGTVDALGNYDWSQFESIKQAFFDPARRAVFHYAIYADTIGGTAAGGISRGIPAADFVIAAGHPSWNGGLTVSQERNLFMHELGHNLALRHGGGDDLNYKPNYHSVLNYLWSLVGVPPDNRSDYSPFAEETIDESLAGDRNGDGRISMLLGHQDWPNLAFSGGGIGDLQALPAPSTTPLDPIDPEELRQRGAYARGGDALLHFAGPSVLVRNSGTQSVTVDVTNISEAAGDYLVTADNGFLTQAVSAPISIGAGQTVRVSLPVDTGDLVVGEYSIRLTLRSVGGELLHQQPAGVVVIDLTDPQTQQAAEQALSALVALPPDSGLDPAIRDQIVRMFELAAQSWRAEVRVTGAPGFDAIYRIQEPLIQRSPGRIVVRSVPGAPLCELDLVRAGKAAAGTVRLQRPSGDLFDAPIAGSWNESTRTFEGKWLDGKRAGGSIAFRLQEP